MISNKIIAHKMMFLIPSVLVDITRYLCIFQLTKLVRVFLTFYSQLKCVCAGLCLLFRGAILFFIASPLLRISWHHRTPPVPRPCVCG